MTSTRCAPCRRRLRREGGATPGSPPAAGGVLFRNAHAHNVVTLPSHATPSGRLPFGTAGGKRGFAFRRKGGGGTRLSSRAIAPALVSAFTLDSRFELDRGFDVYDDRFADGAEASAFVLPERPGAETAALARDWLAAGDGRPAFAWVHLYDPHAPYRPAEPYASLFADDPYLGDVAAADAALADLIAPLFAPGARPMLVVLTADHGESLGEHGEKTHGVFAYESTLHGPARAVRAGRPAGARIDATVGHVDIVPTILDALGEPVPDSRPAGACCPSSPAPPTRRARRTSRPSGLTNRGWAPLTEWSTAPRSSSTCRWRSCTRSTRIPASGATSSRNARTCARA